MATVGELDTLGLASGDQTFTHGATSTRIGASASTEFYSFNTKQQSKKQNKKFQTALIFGLVFFLAIAIPTIGYFVKKRMQPTEIDGKVEPGVPVVPDFKEEPAIKPHIPTDAAIPKEIPGFPQIHIERFLEISPEMDKIFKLQYSYEKGSGKLIAIWRVNEMNYKLYQGHVSGSKQPKLFAQDMGIYIRGMMAIALDLANKTSEEEKYILHIVDIKGKIPKMSKGWSQMEMCTQDFKATDIPPPNRLTGVVWTGNKLVQQAMGSRAIAVSDAKSLERVSPFKMQHVPTYLGGPGSFEKNEFTASVLAQRAAMTK